MTRAWISLLTLSSLVACVQPVKRDEAPAMPVIKTVAVNPDLVKKRLWILEFSEKTAGGAPEFKDAHPKVLLQKAMIKAFSVSTSPYLADIADDGGRIEVSMDSSASVDDIQKAAHTSGVSGFVRGTITDLRIESKGGTEGLMRSSTKEIKMSVEYDLYDGVTGRKIFNGFAHHSIADTRSGFFVDSNQNFGDPGAKLSEISREIADKILVKLASVADKLGWSGRVVKMDGTRIYLNAGRKTGLQAGDIVKVVDPSKDIIDPQTGTTMGQAPGRLKATLKIIDHFGTDGAVAVLLSGGGVNINDSVELN